MNTADRSIAMMDFAVRRRFRLLSMRPSRSIVEEYYDSPSRADVAWAILEAINASISDPDYHVGQSYVMTSADADDDVWVARFCEKIVREARPLLVEYHEESLMSSSVMVSFGAAPLDVMHCAVEELASAVMARVSSHA
jgi:hypothetical protein